MPGQDVDDAAFPVDRERHFAGELPAAKVRDQLPDHLMHPRVTGVESAGEIRGWHPGNEIHPATERFEHGPNTADPNMLGTPGLDQ
jgi:hypothetical protein